MEGATRPRKISLKLDDRAVVEISPYYDTGI